MSREAIGDDVQKGAEDGSKYARERDCLHTRVIGVWAGALEGEAQNAEETTAWPPPLVLLRFKFVSGVRQTSYYQLPF